ncbi:hypothetical protein D3C87_1852030 [compost metagenome]
MSIRMLIRCGAALFLFALGSGCSLIGLGDSGRTDECKWNRSSCLYDGGYEAGEEDYAEEEAKRLNKDAANRLRRSSGN